MNSVQTVQKVQVVQDVTGKFRFRRLERLEPSLKSWDFLPNKLRSRADLLRRSQADLRQSSPQR